MSPTPERDDDALLAELGEVLRMNDQLPADVIVAAKELFTWRTVDAELAALTFDSLLDDEPAAVRSTVAAPRVVTFETDDVTIELEIESGPAGRRLLGQLVPPVVGGLEMDSTEGSQHIPVDELGRFVAALSDEPQRIVLRLGTGPGAVTVVAVL